MPLFEPAYFGGIGKRGVKTELPAATTLLQSRSERDDSEKTLKLCLKSFSESTTAGAPLDFRISSSSGMIYFDFWISSSASTLRARIFKSDCCPANIGTRLRERSLRVTSSGCCAYNSRRRPSYNL